MAPESKNVSVRNLSIDGNWSSNYPDDFNGDGVLAVSSSAVKARNISVEHTNIKDCPRLCVQLIGQGMSIRNNTFGDARSDVAEIVAGPGSITNNYVELHGLTGHGARK